MTANRVEWVLNEARMKGQLGIRSFEINGLQKRAKIPQIQNPEYTSYVAAVGESHKRKKKKKNRSARSLASALNGGALTRSPKASARPTKISDELTSHCCCKAHRTQSHRPPTEKQILDLIDRKTELTQFHGDLSLADRGRDCAAPPTRAARGTAQQRNPAMTWWVVQCESQREHIVRVLLMRARYETYIPRIKHRSRISPLFPSYLFVRSTDRWYPVRWTDHVVRVLMSGDQPAQLPEAVITSIRKRESGGFVKLPAPPQLRKGQHVRVIRGSFEGLLAIHQAWAAGNGFGFCST